MGPNRIVVSEQPQSTTIIELIFTLRPSKWAASTKWHGDIDIAAQYLVRGHLSSELATLVRAHPLTFISLRTDWWVQFCAN